MNIRHFFNFHQNCLNFFGIFFFHLVIAFGYIIFNNPRKLRFMSAFTKNRFRSFDENSLGLTRHFYNFTIFDKFEIITKIKRSFLLS